MKVIIQVAYKKTVLDPQGRAITQALQGHGHQGIVDVRQGKFFEIELASGTNPKTAQKDMEKLAAEVLANPVIEDFTVNILE